MRECRILVDFRESRLAEELNRMLAEGWAITQMSSAATSGDGGTADHFVTVIVERERPATDAEVVS